jgi:hypothetical protein
MVFLEQLLDLIISPYGLLGISLSLILILQASPSRPRFHWFLLALCGFSASLSKFSDEFIKEPPPLIFPLQQLRDAGRPLTIVLLGLLLLLAFKTRKGWRHNIIPKPIFYLVLVQAIIFLKTLTYGSLEFAFLSALTFGCLVLMVILGPSRWLQDDRNFQLGAWSVAMVGVIFVIANSYQAAIDLYPIIFVHGWFLGTTGNPQHAATLLTATIPCFLFLLTKPEQPIWVKWFWTVLLGLIALGLMMTSSRTGVLMALTSLLIFYRRRQGLILRLGLTFGVILAVVFSFLDQGAASFLLPDKLSSLNNTRGIVWNALWQQFVNNPIVGGPLLGDRLGYGESSWLSAGATLGLLGFIPLVLFGIECLRMIRQLNHLSTRSSGYYFPCSTVIAGLASLLVGSFAEAYLLGTITFSLLVLLIYLVLGNYLLEKDRAISHIQSVGFPIPNSGYWSSRRMAE